MWIILIIAALLLLLFIIAVVFFFRFAFVRFKKADADNLESETNRILEPYMDTIAPGFQFIENTEHTWVETKSFDGLKLAARYYKTSGSNRTMILFHGYRSSAKRDFSCAVRMYCEMGLNVLLVDQRSHGNSEGRLITYGIKESRDVISWIDFVLENYGNDTEIFLGGMSMGATTVLLAAGLDLPCNVKGIVADCGFTSAKDIIFEVAKKSFHINGMFFYPVFDIICRVKYGFSLYGTSTVDAMKRSRIPVLFIHGKKDAFVPCEMSERGFAAAECEKKIVLVEGAGHGFSYLVNPELVRAELNDFITKH